MRIIGSLLAGIIGIAALFWFTNKEETVKENTDTISNVTTSAKPVSTDATIHQENNTQPKTQAPSISPEGAYTFRLSGKDRREGEPDKDYKLRLEFHDDFKRFEGKANLTPEQSEKVLGIIGDIQQESRIAWNAMDDTKDGPNMKTMNDTLTADLRSRMREVLTPNQMDAFRRNAGVSSPLVFGLFQPIDIEGVAYQPEE